MSALLLHHVLGLDYSRSHSRWFWGMRLHLLGAPDGTIRAVIWSGPGLVDT
jgi:hypothetical protein